MSLRRYVINLPIPEDEEGKLPTALLTKPTSPQLTAMADMTWLQIILTMIRRLKSYATDIKPTEPSMEPIIAKVHKCYHDETPPRPCEQEVDI